MTIAEDLNTWLALEHEAVWLYPIIGARFEGLRPRATRSFESHRNTRDALLGRLQKISTEPVSTRLSYGAAPTSRAHATSAAQDLESRIAAACLQLTGEAGGSTRSYAIKNLHRAATASQTWGAPPRAFPGLPDAAS